MIQRLNFIWRAFATVIGFGLFGLGTCLLTVVFVLPIRVLPIAESVKQRWLLVSVHRSAALLIHFCKLSGLLILSRQGPELSFHQGHLIVANHPSLIDALFVLASSKNLCCIVKADLLRNPFTRYIVELAGYIPNSSETLLIDSANALAEGNNLLVFPEGTRNTSDAQLDFKRGAANIALTTGCPVTPVIFTYFPRTLQKNDRWYSIPKTTPRVFMTSYPPLESQRHIDTDSPSTLQARQLTAAWVDFFKNRIHDNCQQPCPADTSAGVRHH